MLFAGSSRAAIPWDGRGERDGGGLLKKEVPFEMEVIIEIKGFYSGEAEWFR